MSDESTNIINNTVYINDEVIPFGAYQAIFHKLTKKVDRIRRIFNGGYTINPDDIINLHMCVMQSLQQYNIQGSQVEITHVEKKQGSRTFNSIDMFRCANITSREQTSSIAYSIDFLIVLPAQIEQSKDIAQRYKLTIIIDKDEVDDNDTSVPFFLRGYIGTPDIKMSLEYSDYMVAQALNSTVSGWINSLPKQKESKCLLNLKKIEGKVRGFLPHIMRTLPIVGGIINIKQNNFDMHHLFILLMVCMILSIISEPIGDFCIDGIFKNVNLLGPRMLLNFTNGDRDRIEEIEKKKKTFRSRASFFLITILVSFGINIFSTWIYPYLEKM